MELEIFNYFQNLISMYIFLLIKSHVILIGLSQQKQHSYEDKNVSGSKKKQTTVIKIIFCVTIAQ